MKPHPWGGDGVRCLFLDPVTGAGVLDTGAPLDVTYRPKAGRLTVAAMLATADAHGVRRVFLTGTKPPSTRWLDETPEGWTPAGHFYQLRDPCGRWRGGVPARVVEVRRVAAWFGEGDYTPAEARAAMFLVATYLRNTTRDRVGLMGSPAAVGQSLWADSLGPDGRDKMAGQLDERVGELVRSTSPQHREEVIGRCFDDCDEHLPAPAGKLPEVCYLDAMFMYAACARELGAAPAALVEGERYAASFWQQYPYRRATYRVRFTVPADWTRAGLLPVKHPNGRNWHYPNRPGLVGTTWVDAAELHVAARNGWRVEPLDFVRYTEGRPLDTFTARIVRAREVCEGERSAGRAATMASAAFRSMFVRTIGAFHSRGRDRTYVVAPGVDLPAGVTEWETRDDGTRVYTSRVEPTGNAAAFVRPELSAQVWARARARVADLLLTVDPAAVVAVWGDALYLASDPGLTASKPGEFRVKGRLSGPVARPKTIGELLRLREKMGES